MSDIYVKVQQSVSISTYTETESSDGAPMADFPFDGADLTGSDEPLTATDPSSGDHVTITNGYAGLDGTTQIPLGKEIGAAATNIYQTYEIHQDGSITNSRTDTWNYYYLHGAITNDLVTADAPPPPGDTLDIPVVDTVITSEGQPAQTAQNEPLHYLDYFWVDLGPVPGSGSNPTGNPPDPGDAGGAGHTSPPTYTIAASPGTTLEGNPSADGNTVLFTVTRTGDVSAIGTVDVTFTGTALQGSDYTVAGLTGPTANQVAVAAGAASATFSIVTIPDIAVEPDESVFATIGNPQGQSGAAIGTQNSASAVIVNDDIPTIPAGPGIDSGTGQGGGAGPSGGAGTGGASGGTVTDPAAPAPVTGPAASNTTINDPTPVLTPSPVVTTGITGEPFTSTVDTYDSAGTLIQTSYLKPNGKIYYNSSYTAQPDGGSSYTYADGAFFRNKDFSSFSDSYDAEGNLVSHIEYNKDGSHTVEVDGNKQHLALLGADTVTDNAENTRFIFHQGVGQETISGFRAGGPGHDVISLPASDADKLAQVLLHATGDGQGNTTIHLGHGDSITLIGVSKAELQKHEGAFVFRT